MDSTQSGKLLVLVFFSSSPNIPNSRVWTYKSIYKLSKPPPISVFVEWVPRIWPRTVAILGLALDILDFSKKCQALGLLKHEKFMQLLESRLEMFKLLLWKFVLLGKASASSASKISLSYENLNSWSMVFIYATSKHSVYVPNVILSILMLCVCVNCKVHV